MQWWATFVNAALFFLSLFMPAWKSLEAIESPRSEDDRQWLSYWLVYAVMVMLEKALWPILKWFPLYPELKVILAAWLVLPQFKGALYTQELYVLPALIVVRDYLRSLPLLQDLLSSKSPTSTAPGEQVIVDMAAKRAQAATTLNKAKRILDAELDKIAQAKGSGNTSEQKTAEKAFLKSMNMLDKMVTKGGGEDVAGERDSAASVHTKLGGSNTASKEKGMVQEYS